MAQAVANVAFWHGGRKFHVGDVIDSSEDVYSLYPTRFTLRYTGAFASVGTSGTAAGTLGSLLASEAVLDSNGTVVGYRPVYGTITP